VLTQAGCNYWGRHQGCEFISTRCGARLNDLSARAGDSEETGLCHRLHPTDQRCFHRGDPKLGGICNVADTFLLEHCALPRCDRAWPDGGWCNAECFDGVENNMSMAALAEGNGDSWDFDPDPFGDGDLGDDGNETDGRMGGGGCMLVPTGPVSAATDAPYDPVSTCRFSCRSIMPAFAFLGLLAGH
jgi:hypothetical protein